MVTAYPVAGKQKSRDICTSFIRGCGGQLATAYRPGPAFFYGVDESNVEIWNRVREAGDDFYYCDNSYFDAKRQGSFRVTRNRLQHSGFGSTNGRRFAALGIEIKPWRRDTWPWQNGQGHHAFNDHQHCFICGVLETDPDEVCRGVPGHIVVCPQSDHFMRTIARRDGDWLAEVTAKLAECGRPVRVRAWSPNKAKLSSTLEQDLAGAHALITWSSAAAVTALLAGVPVIVHAEDCAARSMAGDPWRFEKLAMPGDRLRWAGVLADNEWSLAEFENGTAWRMLHGC